MGQELRIPLERSRRLYQRPAGDGEEGARPIQRGKNDSCLLRNGGAVGQRYEANGGGRRDRRSSSWGCETPPARTVRGGGNPGAGAERRRARGACGGERRAERAYRMEGDCLSQEMGGECEPEARLEAAEKYAPPLEVFVWRQHGWESVELEDGGEESVLQKLVDDPAIDIDGQHNEAEVHHTPTNDRREKAEAEGCTIDWDSSGSWARPRR